MRFVPRSWASPFNLHGCDQGGEKKKHTHGHWGPHGDLSYTENKNTQIDRCLTFVAVEALLDTPTHIRTTH